MNEPFVPDEQSIRDTMRQEIHLTKEEPAGGARHRKVSFLDNPGRPSWLKQQRLKSRQQIASKSL